MQQKHSGKVLYKNKIKKKKKKNQEVFQLFHNLSPGLSPKSRERGELLRENRKIRSAM